MATTVDTQIATDNPTSNPSDFEFTGVGGEYFKIWIVNILLTIVTLGIYSAWAKVRRKRYFYGNTWFDNSTFEYHADPINILKGRVIGFILFAAYIGIGSISPILNIVMGFLFLGALPWLVIKGLAFNARNSSYRNIRFNFNAKYGESAWVFVGLMLLTFLSFGLLTPFLLQRQSQFFIEKSLYGTSYFGFGASPGQFYRAFVGPFLFFIVLGTLEIVVLQQSGLLESNFKEITPGEMPLAPMLAGMSMAIVYLGAFVWLQKNIQNLIWSHASLATMQFQSILRARDLLWLYVSNTLLIVLTLGLFIPWAQVRTTRYRLSKLSLINDGNLDGFIQGELEKTHAAGEEIGEFFDVDLSI